MNRIVLALLIVAALGALAYKNQPPPEKGPIVYSESRFALNIPGREMEFVVIGQRYETADCRRDSVAKTMQEVCTAENFCVESRHECKRDVDQRYKNMLGKQSSSTHYVHMQHQTEPLQGVALFWGLTDAESQMICQQLVQKIEAHQGVPVSARCI